MTSTDPPPLRRRWWLGPVIFLVTVILGFVAAEFIFRFICTARYRAAVAKWDDKLYVPEPDSAIDYHLHPGAEGRNPFFFETSRTFDYRLNADGFRGRLFSDETSGAKRILVLGDSYAFGWALNQDQPPFPARLERLLNGDGATTRALVFNAGVPGYNTIQEEALLDRLLREGKRFDAVVLAYVVNDAEPQASAPVRPAVTYRVASSWLLAEALEIANAHVLHGKIRLLGPRKNLMDLDYRNGFAPNHFKARGSFQALQRIQLLCRDYGMRVEVFILPDFGYPWGTEYQFKTIHEQVAEWGRMLEVPTYDLMEEFAGEDHKRYQVEGDGHPNEAAHERIAERMARELRGPLGL